MSRPTRETPAGRAYLDLQRRARAEGRGTQELLTLYAIERWLARLAASPYANQFVLKGGVLLAAFGARRTTVDADALARGFANDERSVVERVVAVAKHPVADDGVVFLTETATSRIIRDEALYSGVRIAMDAAIAAAVIKLRLDINFGDPITPAPQPIDLPAVRPGQPPVRILGYPLETVLAEKIATAIALGPANTRVRDYADIYTLTAGHELRHQAVRQALLNTAAHRGIDVVALSTVIDDFAQLRAGTYTAYRTGLGPEGVTLPRDFQDVINAVTTFADALAEEALATRWDPAARSWA